MKKENMWRFRITIINLLILIYGLFNAYSEKIGLCKRGEYCFLQYNEYIDPLIFVSISFGIISLILFFISTPIFKKWLKFAIVWLALTTLLVIISPTYSGGWVGFGPTKELVSIWMGSLFVISSLIMFVVLTIREKRK